MQTIRVTLALLLASFLSSCGHFGYEVKRQKVVHAIWDGSGRVERPLEGADAKTFIVIKPYHYAKDKHAVYYYQTVIKGATPSTFTLLDDWYAVDSESVFYQGAVLPDRDAQTFETMSGYWTRDKNDVYFLNRAIKACEQTSFKIVFGRWAVDAQCAYSGEAIVEEADRQTFQAVNDHYAKDKHYVYARVTRRIATAEPATGKFPYLYKNILSKVLDADVESFTASDTRACDYDARDKFRCYRRGEAAPCDCNE